MRRTPLLLLTLVLGSALAGCAGAPAEPTSVAAASDATEAPAGGAVAWPPLEAATIRPGVRVGPGGGICTTNFVFASPDNATLYLGTAAHCVIGLKLGDAMDIVGSGTTGTLAYSSRLTMNHTVRGLQTPLTPNVECDEGIDADACANNDFALLRIGDEDRAKVHPAVLHVGGPTRLVESTGISVGDALRTYGNSPARGDLDPLKPRHGLVVERASDWITHAYFATPTLPGDSGSAVLAADGGAAGILVTFEPLPPGATGITHLDLALRFALDHAGFDVRLATWPLLDA